MTRYAESALKAQSQTQRWCPVRVASRGKGRGKPLSSVRAASSMSTSQIFAVWSAEHVASFLTSGDSRMRVMYSLCAENCVMGCSSVRSKVWIRDQTKTLPCGGRG